MLTAHEGNMISFPIFWYRTLSGCCDAWWRARQNQSLAGGLGAGLSALRHGCVCTLVFEDPTQWCGASQLWPASSLLRFKGISKLLFSLVTSRCRRGALKLLKVFTQIWHGVSCVMWPGFSEPMSNGRLLSLYFWVLLSRSTPTRPTV